MLMSIVYAVDFRGYLRRKACTLYCRLYASRVGGVRMEKKTRHHIVWIPPASLDGRAPAKLLKRFH